MFRYKRDRQKWRMSFLMSLPFAFLTGGLNFQFDRCMLKAEDSNRPTNMVWQCIFERLGPRDLGRAICTVDSK